METPSHSFVFMLIRPTALILKQILFWNFVAVTRLEGLISIKTEKYFIWPPLWKRSMPAHFQRALMKSLFLSLRLQ